MFWSILELCIVLEVVERVLDEFWLFTEQLVHSSVLICKMGKAIPSLSLSQCFSEDQIQIHVKNIKLYTYFIENLLINVSLCLLDCVKFFSDCDLIYSMSWPCLLTKIHRNW